MCPLTCKIVKEAIQAHEERGVVMVEYVERHKECYAYCLMCTRNDHSTLPEHMKKDMGVKVAEEQEEMEDLPFC